MECCVCGREATVLDTEYGEGYCDRDADAYEVWDGPYRVLDEASDSGV
jgi:hypothetical protein